MNSRIIRAAFTGSICVLSVLTTTTSNGSVLAQGSRADYARAKDLRKLTRGKAHLARVEPNWFAAETKMWYIRQQGGQRQFLLVDCVAGTRRPAFDHERLATALKAAGHKNLDATRLTISALKIKDDLSSMSFSAFGSKWTCSLGDYQCKKTGKAEAARPQAPRNNRRGRGRRGSSRGRGRSPRRRGRRSPDGQWEAKERDHDLYLQPAGEGEQIQLTEDGEEGHRYSPVAWSPDSKTLLAVKTRPGKIGEVPLIDSSPRDQLTAKFRTRPYARPGDRFPHHDLLLFDVASKRATKVKTRAIDSRERGSVRPRWSKDSRSFTFERTDRGHKRFRIHEVDAKTGEIRTLLDERTADYKAGDTFINGWGRRLQYLQKSGQILFTSERDGWKHIYLQDMKPDASPTQVTAGAWVVRAIDSVDEDRKVIWFQASGMNQGQDPYFLHFYRINFDGTGLVALTDGDGTHSIAYSPKREYLIDTWSRADLPPVCVLRRVSDGKLVCELEKSDLEDLLATGWKLPEPFHAKGRDGKMDIWGILYRPSNFQPGTRYPIIEDIYAGPHSSHVAKGFSTSRSQQTLAELGFIVVKIDGMGTSNRSKAFHDVCWQNVGDAGLPDRILWIKAAAKEYPYMDITRVGIFGTSAGGQSSTGALLFHPDFYKVAVSACGCHDNRLDKASWNEQWMGYPVGPHYAAQSNIDNAHKLQGKLFLIVGELDTNVPPESTMRVVDALIRADKDFDLLVIPGASHTSGGSYGNRRRWDFFVRHLHGREPRW